MSTWRRKALELFPDLRNEIQAGDTTIYTVFFELTIRCREAHRQKNEEELEKIYTYAEWCFRQNAKDLWNAAAVSFYEHLGDHKETKTEIHKWVKPDIFWEIADLLQYMMGEKEFDKVRRHYDHRKKLD